MCNFKDYFVGELELFRNVKKFEFYKDFIFRIIFKIRRKIVFDVGWYFLWIMIFECIFEKMFFIFYIEYDLFYFNNKEYIIDVLINVKDIWNCDCKMIK